MLNFTQMGIAFHTTNPLRFLSICAHTLTHTEGLPTPPPASGKSSSSGGKDAAAGRHSRPRHRGAADDSPSPPSSSRGGSSGVSGVHNGSVSGVGEAIPAAVRAANRLGVVGGSTAGQTPSTSGTPPSGGGPAGSNGAGNRGGGGVGTPSAFGHFRFAHSETVMPFISMLGLYQEPGEY